MEWIVIGIIGITYSVAETSHPGLDNVIVISPRVINGSAPASDEAFESLTELGVKTIICVDGAPPDVESASRRGMRYVHLPVGYDGIREDQGLRIVRAVRDLPGPIYIHCHHGKHRSPAVSAYVLVGLGLASPEQATALMKRAGTSTHYAGLYETIARATRISDEALDDVVADFPARARAREIVELMVALERTLENLGACQKAGWQSPAGAPDLQPEHEAAIMESALGQVVPVSDRDDSGSDAAAETGVGERSIVVDDAFRRFAKDSETDAQRLARALSQSSSGAALDAALSRLRAGCRACHDIFRDAPR